jgi:hypothetical protein
MKTLKLLLGMGLLLCFSHNAHGVTYTSINAGNWNDVVNVWSTNGGVTPCGCNPGPTSSGNDIIINDAITMNFAVTINGGSNISVLASGKVNGAQDLTIANGSADFFSSSTLGTVVINNGSMILYTGAVVTTGNLQVQAGGTLTLDGAQLNSGQTRVFAGGTLNLINAARYRCVTSNFRNNGTINISSDCCIATNGNFQNNAGGVVNGNGVIDSGGNLNNSGVWSINVDWCANGAGLGLPNPENCGAVGIVCGAIVLPVELVNFSAEVVNENNAVINWETASEHNNDYFLLFKSTDGVNWVEVDKVLGAGNSTEHLYYQSIDYKLKEGVTYFKLLQFDFDARINESEIISIDNKNTDITIYPNPVRIGDNITISLGNEVTELVILNQNGGMVFSQDIENQSTVVISTIEMHPGMYFVQSISNEQIEIRKIAVVD